LVLPPIVADRTVPTEAVKLELGQKYIKSLTKLKSNGNNVIMGGNLADMKEMLKGLDIEI